MKKTIRFCEDDRVVVLACNDNPALIGQVGVVIHDNRATVIVRFENKIPKGHTLRERCYSILNSESCLRFAKKGEKSPVIPEPVKIANYEVNNFNSDGFNVGCHRISWDVYDKIGKYKPKK